MNRHKELVHPKCLGTIEDIRALKKTEQTPLKQKEVREGVKSLLYLALVAILLYLIITGRPIPFCIL